MTENKVYDACVIGSGAAGGVVAKILAEKGARVAVLEAGDWLKPSEFKSHMMPYDFKYRGLRSEYTNHIFVDRQLEPLSEESEYPVRVSDIKKVGGKTLLWAGHALRFGPRDFDMARYDGVGDIWPITYEEIAPYYDAMEALMGVSGSREGHPNLPPGKYLPPAPFRCGEALLSKAAEKVGLKVVPVPKAILTEDYDGRLKCHYCGHCMLGCDTTAKYTSAVGALAKALKTGRCQLIVNAHAREILLDKSGKRVEAVLYVDRKTRQERTVRARVIAVACGAVESARLLLLSRSRFFPNGLANSSSWVGRNLMTHTVGGRIMAILKDLKKTSVTNDDGTGVAHGVIPSFYWKERHKNFVRGYLIHVGTGYSRYVPYAKLLPGFGIEFKQLVRDAYPGFVSYFDTRGEMLPSERNYVEIDWERRDFLGIPVAKVHFHYGDNELAMFDDMYEKLEEILRAANAEILPYDRTPRHDSVHWVGTCRMGLDPRTSVLNPFCQSHDVRNLFVVDGSCFVQYAEKNPTLTVMALAARSADYMVEKLKKNEL